MTKSQRVAIFYNLPGGGSVRYLKKIHEHLIKNNKVDVFSIKERADIKIGRGEKTEIVKPWKTFFGRNLWIIFKLPQIHKKISKNINKKEYKFVIIGQDYFTKAPYLLKYIKTKKIYILQEPQREFHEPWSMHAPYFKDKAANVFRLFIKFIDIKYTKYADLIICNSKYSRKIIKKVYKKKAQVIYPGVDVEKFKPNKKRKKKKQILLIGGWSKTKGHDFVVKSLGDLLNKYQVIIVGTGRKKDKKRIINLSNNYKNKIKWLEEVSDAELIKLYQESLLLCVGYFREPFGMTSIESQACGTLVVGIKEGGLTETIIDGETGFLSEREEKVYKENVIRGLKNYKKLSSNGRKNIVKNWSWLVTFKNFNKLIK